MRDFGRVWMSAFSSGASVAMSLVGLSWAALLVSSPLAVGSTLAARLVAPLLLGVPFGQLIDRLPRTQVIVWVSVAGAFVSAMLALIAVAGVLTIELVVAFAFVLGAIETAKTAATQALVYDLVGPQRSTTGIATSNVGYLVSRSIGAIVGGVIVAEVSIGAGFAAASACWLVSALTLVGAANPPQVAVSRLRGRFAAVTLLAKRSAVARIAGVLILCEVFGFSSLALAPTFARDVLFAGASGVGVLIAARSLGGVAGLSWLAVFAARSAEGRVLVAMASIFGAALLVFALSESLVLSVALMFVTGFASGAIDTLGPSLLQRAADEHLRGAAMGVWMLTIGCGPIGLIVLGGAGAVVGAPTAQATSGLLLFIGSLAIARTGLMATLDEGLSFHSSNT